MQPSGAPAIWLDDAHPIFRRGMAACLKAEGFRVVGESAHLSPKPPRRGLDALVFEAEGRGLADAVRSVQGGATRLVALLPSPVESLVGDAVEAGVAAVLVRADLAPATLVACLRAVVNGNATLPTHLLHRLLERAANGARRTASGLTSRELEVLRLLADGGDTREIADTLSYSERTVKNVVHDVLMKMNCRNRAHAVALATRQGVI